MRNPSLVGDGMTTGVVTLGEAEPLRQAVELVMVRRIRHLPILDAAGRLAGIVTDRDIKRILPSPLSLPTRSEYEAALDDTPVSRVMTRDPLVARPDTDVATAVGLMLEHAIGGLPVVDDGRVVGIFTRGDALRGYLHLLRELAR